MRWAASAIVCRPDEQKRLTVMPETDTGNPARIAACRAMSQPVAPSGLAQPRITSSIASGSMPARATAWRTTWPAMVAPWVLLSAPRQDLARAVRAVETMATSFIDASPSVDQGIVAGGQEKSRGARSGRRVVRVSNITVSELS